MAKQKKKEEVRILDEFENSIGRKAKLFELGILGVIPRDVYGAIKDRLELTLSCLETGTEHTATAVDILKDFLGHD